MSSTGQTVNLQRLGEPEGLVSYVRSVWERREFIWNIASGNLRAQHMDTTLGNLWHLVNPMLMLGVYYLAFGVLLPRATAGTDNFVGFLAVGIFVYRYCQQSMTSGANSIVNNVGLIRSLQFPRAVLPVAAVVQQFVAFLSGVVVMLLMLLATGERASLGWFMFVPITALATIFGAGGAFITSRMTDQVRDIQNVLPYLFRLTFYLSGILFSVEGIVTEERFGDSAETIKTLFLFNPFYDIVGLARHYLMSSYSEPQFQSMWIFALIITAVTVVVGVLYFRAGEGSYGRG